MHKRREKCRKLEKSTMERKGDGEGKSVKSGDAARSVQLPSAVAWIDWVALRRIIKPSAIMPFSTIIQMMKPKQSVLGSKWLFTYYVTIGGWWVFGKCWQIVGGWGQVKIGENGKQMEDPHDHDIMSGLSRLGGSWANADGQANSEYMAFKTLYILHVGWPNIWIASQNRSFV